MSQRLSVILVLVMSIVSSVSFVCPAQRNSETQTDVRHRLALVLNPERPKPLQPKMPVKASFAWGAEFGGSLDMSAHDMSSIDFNAYFGFRRGWINFLGVGAEIDIMVSNSCRSFPVYLDFRTNFSNRPTLLFLDIRGGQAYNYLPGDYRQSGVYAFVGVGVNLARGKKFCSHLLMGYTYKEYSDYTTRIDEEIRLADLHMATFKLGITF